MSDAPWWWPEEADADWIQRMRDDYPDDTDEMDDEEIIDVYANGCQFPDVWDHVGDARDQWHELAKAFLALVAETGKSPADFK